jgi:hypothetical protein
MAMLIAAVAVAAGGVLAFATIRNPPRRAATAPPAVAEDSLNCAHCALDAPPLRFGPEDQRESRPAVTE